MTRNAFWGLCIGICMASTQSVAQKIENTLKSATKPFNLLLACTCPLVTEFADN